MRQRCNDSNHQKYPSYGARGIRVCERWNDFALFLSDMGVRPSSRHSIERIDNDVGYEPSNCRWATGYEQGRNTRRTKHIIYRGLKTNVASAVRSAGSKVHPAVAAVRIDRGWPVEAAVETPPYGRKRAP
jgi:hypothetical protein